MKVRKKPVVVDAHLWEKNGDHPDDYKDDPEALIKGWEGRVVRHFRHPGVPGDSECQHCGRLMHRHGWVDTLEGGHTVCPRDYIITGVEGEYYPIKPGIYAKTYESAEHPELTGHREVFIWAVKQLCNEEPPRDLVEGWWSNDDDFRLNEWLKGKIPTNVDVTAILSASCELATQYPRRDDRD